jgi:hypothetical protein
MAELENATIKKGGLFSPKMKVIYELKHERPMGDGTVKSITMYKQNNGDIMGELQYTLTGGGAVHLDSIILHDTECDFAYEEALMYRFLKQVKKDSAREVSGEILDTGERSHRQIDVLEKAGFDIRRIGNITGVNQFGVYLKVR